LGNGARILGDSGALVVVEEYANYHVEKMKKIPKPISCDQTFGGVT
jgi:hypothetical protein